MLALVRIILLVIEIYIYLLVAMAVLSWLIAFNVINTRNRFVATVIDFLYRITEPLLRPLRRIVPNLGGIDITPAAANNSVIHAIVALTTNDGEGIQPNPVGAGVPRYYVSVRHGESRALLFSMEDKGNRWSIVNAPNLPAWIWESEGVLAAEIDRHCVAV